MKKIVLLLSFFALIFAAWHVYCYDWKRECKLKIAIRKPPQWMKDQIREDLASFDSRDLHPDQLGAVMEETLNREEPFMLARFRIQKNSLHKEYVGKRGEKKRYEVIEKSLQQLLKIASLPDMDFLVVLEDSADGKKFTAPVFAFAKNASLKERVILMPDFEALSGNSRIMGAVRKGLKRCPWKKRKELAIWRGAMTGLCDFTVENFLTAPRSQLIAESLMYPDLIDAKFVGISQCKKPYEVLKEFLEYYSLPMDLIKHFNYKYQILVDGNSCAYSRAYWQLFSRSVIFKQDSPNIQWFYRCLIPNTHYIPVASDFNNLKEKIEWAKNNDKEVHKISVNAQKFALKNLKRSDVYFYLYHLLCEYAKKQCY